jgi:hypothetical protein
MDGTTGSGDIYYDYINVGGITVWTSLVWAKTNFLKGRSSSDGVLGAGFKIDDSAKSSLLQAMFDQGSLLSNVISITLTEHSEGALQLGALDANIINELQYTDMALGKHEAGWFTTISFNGGEVVDA